MTHFRQAAALAAMVALAPVTAGAQQAVQQEPPVAGGQAAEPARPGMQEPAGGTGEDARGEGPARGGETGGQGPWGGPDGERGDRDHDRGGRDRDDGDRDRRGHGRMGMHHGMMGHGGMGGLRTMMILMDTDGDGALSLEEVQAAHERFFHAMDTDGDGRLTRAEIESFMRGEN